MLNITIIRAVAAALAARLVPEARRDQRGAVNSIEMALMIVGGVAVAGILVAFIANFVNSELAKIK